jgi:hypothetical protein
MSYGEEEMVDYASAAAAPEESFEASFISKLQALNETQQSINTLSCWLRYHHKRSKQAAEIWAAEAITSPVARRLLFIYLLNDVLQTSRRRAPELCDHFGAQMEAVLPQIVETATPQVRDKILRVINVWDERGVLAKPEIDRLRAIVTPGARVSTPTAAAQPSTPIGSKPSVSSSAPLSACLEALQASDVLDRTIYSTQMDSNLAEVLKDAPVDDPSQLGIALGRADAAVALVEQNNATLRSELEDRKRLILLLCTAIERQDDICAQLVSAIGDGEVTLSRVVESRTRLSQVCMPHALACVRALPRKTRARRPTREAPHHLCCAHTLARKGGEPIRCDGRHLSVLSYIHSRSYYVVRSQTVSGGHCITHSALQ